MKKQHGSLYLISLVAVVGLCLAPVTANADVIAWDMVSSGSSGLLNYGTNAPAFGSPGDGFQKYTVGVSTSIPFTLVDDSAGVFLGDVLGIIDSGSDFDEFFGVVDTENNENSGPVVATWEFDISSGIAPLNLYLDLAAMGNFEAADMFEWAWSVDGGPTTTMFTAVADEAGSLVYTLANGVGQPLDDPLLVDGLTLSNVFTTFSTAVSPGSSLVLTLTVIADGGSEGYVVRDIRVTDGLTAPGGGEPIPTMSSMGIAAMVLMLMAGGVFLVRRLH